MKYKHLFQIVVLLAILFSAFGTGQLAQAQAEQTVQIIMRDLTYWDGIYTGNVDSTRYEKWPLSFAETHEFVVTATPLSSGGLTPLLLLLDASGNELARSIGSLTSTQPQGSYYVQVQPESGSGFYTLTIRQVAPITHSSVSTEVDPVSIVIGGTSVATVKLNNVPAEGYTAAEFTCTYDPAFVEVSGIAEFVPGLFGADSATAVNGPQNGSFIFAVAGSNGNKATTNGAVFTFNLKGLQVGQTVIECKARVSTGAGSLADISPDATVVATLTITDIPTEGTLTGKVLACKPVTVNLYNADNSVASSVVAGADGAFSLNALAGTYTAVATAEGFLSAQGAASLTVGNTTVMPQVSLPAGDIDGNGVIDQFDAMTIGMSYNTITPPAADLNCDGNINVLDLELLAGNYRKSGAIAWQ
jgi:hypothetical protein